MEKTLVLIKPDGVQRGLIGTIVSRFESRGLKLVGMKFIHMTDALANQHYSDHIGKPFFEPLVAYIVSAPVVAMVWEGKDAISIVRTTMGKTNPAESPPGTIRGDFGVEVGRNLVHGSDSQKSAEKEIFLFFDESELIDWDRSLEQWIRE